AGSIAVRCVEFRGLHSEPALIVGGDRVVLADVVTRWITNKISVREILFRSRRRFRTVPKPGVNVTELALNLRERLARRVINHAKPGLGGLRRVVLRFGNAGSWRISLAFRTRTSGRPVRLYGDCIGPGYLKAFNLTLRALPPHAFKRNNHQN